MIIFVSTSFIKNYELESDTLNESNLERIHFYPLYPKGLKIFLNKGFVNIDIGNKGGTHWTTFHIKDNKSSYCDSCGGQPDKFLPEQLP